MTTSDLDTESRSAIAAGLPDPSLLTRLANELFRQSIAGSSDAALVDPGLARRSSVSSLTLGPSLPGVGGADLAGASAAAERSTSGVQLTSLSEEQLQALATSTAVPSAAGAVPSTGSAFGLPGTSAIPQSVPTTPPDSIAPGLALGGVPSLQPSQVPGGFGTGALPPVPTERQIPSAGLSGDGLGLGRDELTNANAFSFLTDARSLASVIPAAPTQALPLPATTFVPGPAAPGLVSSAGTSDFQAPALAGTPTTAVPNTQSTFEFLESSRSLQLPSSEVFSLGDSFQPLLQPAAVPASTTTSFDAHAVRRDFPILQERVNGRPLVWLDNAATTQKPKAVIDRLTYFYEHENSNIHRAAHELAARATDAYEGAREKVRRFLNAPSSGNIIFVRGATEGINLVAQTWGKSNIGKGDEIIVSILEHHANIVPWQMLCAETGAKLRVAPVDDTGQLMLDEYQKLFNSRTKLVSITHVSNALGTVTPVHDIVDIAHRHGVRVLIDGSQAVSHMRVDVTTLDCDFYVFSGHKVFAPTGIGAVYGKADVLEASPPYQGGGNMIVDVTFERTTYQPPPFRFEAGTGNIADAVGLGAAFDYLDRIGMVNISRYEHELLVYGTEALQRIPGLKLIGTAKEKASVLSFVLDGFRTEEVGAALNREGIAVRSGHHCAQPILRRFGLESTVRPSLAFYNTFEEIDLLAAAVWNLKQGRSPSVI